MGNYGRNHHAAYAGTRAGTRGAAYGQSRYAGNQAYVTEGSAARKLSALPEYEPETWEKPQRQQRPQPQQPSPRRQREPWEKPEQSRRLKPKLRQGIDFWSMLVLAFSVGVTLLVCMRYLKVSADMAYLDKSIKVLTSELTSVQDRNEAQYSALAQAIDVDAIYAEAVGRLGMVYPNKNEVLTYNAQADGYVRQYGEIPEAAQASVLDWLLP